MGAAHLDPTAVVAAIAKVEWKFCVCRASYWQRSVENFSLMGGASPFPKLVTLELWADVHTELLLWISPRKEQHRTGSDSTAASVSGLREDRTCPSGLCELVTAWPSEEENMGNIWAFPLKLSIGAWD